MKMLLRILLISLAVSTILSGKTLNRRRLGGACCNYKTHKTAIYMGCQNTPAADLDMCQYTQWNYHSGTCEDNGFPVECKMVMRAGGITNFKTAAECTEAHKEEASRRKTSTNSGKPYLCKTRRNRAEFVKNAAECEAI